MSSFAEYFQSLSPENQSIALNSSALTPPPGITPNFDHPPNQDALAQGAIATALVVTLLAVAFATYGKAVVLKKFNWEDGLALGAVISWLAYIGLLYTALTQHGFFIHQWDFRLRDISSYLYPFYVAVLTYFLTTALIKGAIVLEWTRLFVPRGSRNAFWWTCWIVAGANFIASVVQLFVNAFACQPHQAFYDPLVIGTCGGIKATIFIAPIINLVFDLIILVLPQRVIWGLQLSWRRKLGVSVLFALGILAVISTSFRIASAFAFQGSADETYNIAGNYLWSLAEMSAGILIYCAPTIPVAMKSMLGRPPPSRTQLSASGFSSSNKTPRSWPRSEAHTSRRWEELDEMPLRNVIRSSTTVHSDAPGFEHNHEGILRTTKIATVVTSGREQESEHDSD